MLEPATRVGLEQSPLHSRRFLSERAELLLRLGLAPLALFFSSNCRRADLAKLAFLGTLVAVFFLFTAKCLFPGGAFQFIEYADAILQGGTLPPDIAQRDAGYPLLIILSGYPFSHSLIPLLLIQAGFAVALPPLIYEALRRLSPTTAFYTGLASIAMLTPIYFMKMIHHDQTYVFFSIAMLCMLLIFVQTRATRFLYYFTFAAIAASISRPAGNALFPIFLIVSYIAARGNIRHYVACAVIFGLFLAAYSWHRYVIFDEKNAGEMPSYIGEQVFFAPYINTANYGIHLSPKEVGPNFDFAVENLRQLLKPNAASSEFVRQQIAPRYLHSGGPKEFAETNIFPFTPDELIDRILAKPSYDYYMMLCAAADDRVLLHAAFEIARAHPSLIVRYAARNLFHFIFDPGYKHSGFDRDLAPWRAEGSPLFFPAENDLVGVEQGLSGRGAREVSFDPISRQPAIVAYIFSRIGREWRRLYPYEVPILSALMCAAWLTAIIALIHFLAGLRRTYVVTHEPDIVTLIEFADGLIASIIVASLLFGYNAMVTSLFADPSFRYRVMVDLQVLLIAGLGVISIQHWCSAAAGRSMTTVFGKRLHTAAYSMRALDIWQRFTASQLTALVVGCIFAGFAAWALFMLRNTG